MQGTIICGICIGLFLYWLYRCIVIKEEGRHKNVKTFGRFSYTISGAQDKVYDPKTRRLIPGINAGNFAWIWFGFQWISVYKFPWKEPKRSSDVEPGDKNIMSGDPTEDTDVSYYRNEWTDHHRDQHDYRFDIYGVETGEKKGQVAKPGDSPENVKINLFLQGTAVMECPFEAEFRNSAQWHSSLEATLFGTVGEIVSTMVYAELPNIRGEKLEKYSVQNTEPEVLPEAEQGKPTPEFFYKNTDGSRKKDITFLERINYEILVVKRLGVKLINIPLLDYEAHKDSAEYIKSLQTNAISEVNLKTSDNNGKALKNEMQPRIDGAIAIINAEKEAEIAKMKTENVTTTKKFEKLSNLRVFVEGSSGQNMPSKVDVSGLVNTAVGLDLAHEINQAGNDTKKQTGKGGGTK